MALKNVNVVHSKAVNPFILKMPYHFHSGISGYKIKIGMRLAKKANQNNICIAPEKCFFMEDVLDGLVNVVIVSVALDILSVILFFTGNVAAHPTLQIGQ